MQGYGQTTRLGISFQDSGGTSNVDSMHWLPFVNEGVGLDIPPLVSQNMRGVFDEGQDYQGAKMIAGDIVAEAQPLPIGVMLKAVFGEPSTVTSGSLYTHTFKPRTSDWDSKFANQPFTLHKFLGDTGGSAQLFYDLNGNTLQLGVGAGEFLTATMGVVGGTHSQVAPSAASFPTGNRFTWDVASLSIGGSAIDHFSQFSVMLSEQLEAQHTVNGSKYPSRIKRTGFRTVEVSGTLKFETQNELDDFLAGTTQAAFINFVGASNITSGYNEALLLTLPELVWRENKPAAGGPGAIEVSVTGKGQYHVGSANALTVTLVTTQAGY